jgi:hypothetical protein
MQQEVLDRDQIDGAFMLGRALSHESGMTALGLPRGIGQHRDIIIAAGLTPAQRVVAFKAALTVRAA